MFLHPVMLRRTIERHAKQRARKPMMLLGMASDRASTLDHAAGQEAHDAAKQVDM